MQSNPVRNSVVRRTICLILLSIGYYDIAGAFIHDDYTLGVSGQAGFFENNLSAAFVAEGGFYREISVNVINKETDQGFLALPFFTIFTGDPIEYKELGLELGFFASSWEEEAKYTIAFGIKVSRVMIESVEFADPFDIEDPNEKFIIEEQTTIARGIFSRWYALFRNSDHFGLNFIFNMQYIPIDGRFENGPLVQEANDEELFQFKLGLGLIAVF